MELPLHPFFCTPIRDVWWKKLRRGTKTASAVPDSCASHRREQVVDFSPDGLLRTHQYTVDILGGAAGLNYAADYRRADGIQVPTKRRVYAFDADQRKIPEPVLLAIDIAFSICG
ncbi:MAG: hypothetical protein ABSG69_02505 [Candidatus Acidiferrum sp.]